MKWVSIPITYVSMSSVFVETQKHKKKQFDVIEPNSVELNYPYIALL